MKIKCLRVGASGFTFSGMQEEQPKKEAKGRERLQATPPLPLLLEYFHFYVFCIMRFPLRFYLEKNLLRQKNNNKKYNRN